MSGRGRLRPLLAAALIAAGCSSSELARPLVLATVPAQVVVEVLRGFDAPPAAGAASRVELLLDVSSSMQAQTPAGLRGTEMAGSAAERLIDALPESTAIGLSALGHRRGECRAPEAVAHKPAGSTRQGLRGALRALETQSEGSLAAALDLIGAGLGAEPSPQRVVVFTDLGRQCGGDLCESVSGLIGAGVELDLVVVGDAAAPDCVERFVLHTPAEAERQPAPAPPAFRVETRGVGKPVLRVEGLADGKPHPLRSGNAHLVLDLDPPEVIGPIFFPPAARTRVRVLDFPHLGRGVREVHWDTLAAEEIP